MEPVIITYQELLEGIRRIHKNESANDNDAFQQYFYRDANGLLHSINIDRSGTEAFILRPALTPTTMPTTSVSNLNSFSFLYMYIIRSILLAKNVKNILCPIIIDMTDSIEQKIVLDQKIQDTAIIPDNFFETRTDFTDLEKSVALFGVYFRKSASDTAFNLVQLGFDIYNNKGYDYSHLADAYQAYSKSELTRLFIYVDHNLTNEVSHLNNQLKAINIRIINYYPEQADLSDNELSRGTQKINNASSNNLLHHLGKHHKQTKFDDLIKLYTVLESTDKDIDVNCYDFSSINQEDANSKLSNNQIRILALFHLQHPDKPINLTGGFGQVEMLFSKYVANFADRIEGTLSDRLQALHHKEVGKLYAVDINNGYQQLLCRLDSIEFDRKGYLECISISLNDLATNLVYMENRITIDFDKNTKASFLHPLNYGENPFDYRPDFLLHKHYKSPINHKLSLDGGNWVCDTTSHIEILSVIDTLLNSDILKPFMQADLLEFADYSTRVEVGHINYTNQYAIDFTKKDIKEKELNRTLQEKLYIAQSLIHRILRYFELTLTDADMTIRPRLLSLADLVCYKCGDTVYIGVAEVLNPKYKVTPLVPISSRQKSMMIDDESSVSAKNIMALQQQTVSQLIPTSIFNVPDSLPNAIESIVCWLNDSSGNSGRYEDYRTQGLRFEDSWEEFVIIHSCSRDSYISAFENGTSDDFATYLQGSINKIYSAHAEYNLGIIDKEAYTAILTEYSIRYIKSILKIPLYNADFFREREIVCKSKELFDLIDFRFFSSVRYQYSPLTIYATFNTAGEGDNKTVTWHSTLLKD